MSLLQGLLGFGAGAAGAFAEQKKADIEAQRQANLARLKAQYQGEVAAAQSDRQMQLRAAISELPEEQRARMSYIYGVEAPPGSGPAQFKAADIKNFQDISTGEIFTANINDPGVMEQIRNRQITEVSTQKPSERFIEYTTEQGNAMRVDTQTNEVFIQMGNVWKPYPGETQQQELISFEKLPEATGIPGFTGKIDPEAKKPVSGFTPEDYLKIDITDSAGGIFDTLKPKLAGTPILGEIAASAIPDLGKNEKLAARLIQRLSNQILSEEARALLGDTESPRLTNLMLELAQKAASLDSGLFSTPQSVASSVSAAQLVLSDEIERQENLSTNPEASSDQRVAARKFLTTFKPVNQAFNNILDVHAIRRIEAVSPTTGEVKNLREFTRDDIRRAAQAYRDNPDLYNANQLQGLSILARIYGYN